MPKVFPPESKVQWAESKLGKRGSAVVTYKERNIGRTWLMGKFKCPYGSIQNVSIPEMDGAYNDVTDEKLKALAIRCGLTLGNDNSDKQPEKRPNGPMPQDMSEVKPESENKEQGESNDKADTGGLQNYDGNDGQGQSNGQGLDDIMRRIAREEDGKLAKEVAKVVEGNFSSLKAEMKKLVAERKPEGQQVETKIIVVKERADGSKVEGMAKVQHYLYPLLLKAIAAKLNVALVGPAGAGKTQAADNVAADLGLGFTMTGACVLPSAVVGFMDATGQYVKTALYDAYVNGKLHLADEMDAWSPAALLAANAATANGKAAFALGTVERHVNFVMVAAMNTFGTGANRQYVGRNQLDAATLDRYVFIEWPVDTALEAHMVGVKQAQTVINVGEGGIPTVNEWLGYVGRVRDAVNKLGVRHVISPRATTAGKALFEQGIGFKHVKAMAIWKGLDEEQVHRIEREVK